jgi:LacI family transcriptional regulator/LacI family repressor for deo operon, udp, cdd, tsx, nupC, and nupG
MPRRITLADVAAAARMGKSTVSRALANDPTCAPKTRDRIVKLAEEMGYVPDPALSALVSHRENSRQGAQSLALAIVSNSLGGGSSDYVWNLWQAVKLRAADWGYSVESINSTNMEPGALQKMLWARGVRGIIWGWISDSRFLSDFSWERFSHVGFLLPLVRPQIPRVRDDTFRTVLDAVEACWNWGFKRPGLALMTSPGSVNDRFQMAGWLLAHAERNLEPLPIWKNTEESKWTLKEWLGAAKPDVVIGSVSAVYWSLRSFGMKITGADQGKPAISKTRGVGYLNLLHGSELYPGFDCSEDQIGRILVNILDRKIRHNDLGQQENPHTILVRRRLQVQP